jgi:hypothetical protein
MGTRDPHDSSLSLFQEVWAGASDAKIHFMVMSEQEPTAAECIDLMGQIVKTRYTSYDEEGKNKYWQWFTDSHFREMSKLVYDPPTNRWLLNYNDPLKEVLKATNELNLADEELAEETEPMCMITGIHIVDAFWKTSRMGGVAGDQDISSVSSRASTNTMSVIDADPTITEMQESLDDSTALHTHQSIGGSTLPNDFSISSESNSSTISLEGVFAATTSPTMNKATRSADDGATTAAATTRQHQTQMTATERALMQLADNINQADENVPNPNQKRGDDDNEDEDNTLRPMTQGTPPRAAQEAAHTNKAMLDSPGFELPYFGKVAELLTLTMEAPPSLYEFYSEINPMIETWLHSLSESLGKSQRETDLTYGEKLRVMYGLHELYVNYDVQKRSAIQFEQFMHQLPSFAAAESHIHTILGTNPSTTSTLLQRFRTYGNHNEL